MIQTDSSQWFTQGGFLGLPVLYPALLPGGHDAALCCVPQHPATWDPNLRCNIFAEVRSTTMCRSCAQPMGKAYSKLCGQPRVHPNPRRPTWENASASVIKSLAAHHTHRNPRRFPSFHTPGANGITTELRFLLKEIVKGSELSLFAYLRIFDLFVEQRDICRDPSAHLRLVFSLKNGLQANLLLP
jgi:hypothetical protein